MQESQARKLGEVMAFGEVGAETFERGRKAIEGVLGSVDETLGGIPRPGCRGRSGQPGRRPQ